MSGSTSRYDPTLVPAERGAALARNWWLIALRGAIAVLFGVIAFLSPGATIASMLLLFGIYMLVDGVFAIAAGIRAAARHERWGMLILEGVLDLAAGVIAFVYPILTLLAFMTFGGVWAVLSGAALLAAAFRLPADHGRWMMVLAAVASLLWGVGLLVAPFIGAVVITFWLGAYAIVFGVAMLALAFRLRSRHA